jgi:hypothetical protein
MKQVDSAKNVDKKARKFESNYVMKSEVSEWPCVWYEWLWVVVCYKMVYGTLDLYITFCTTRTRTLSKQGHVL